MYYQKRISSEDKNDLFPISINTENFEELLSKGECFMGVTGDQKLGEIFNKIFSGKSIESIPAPNENINCFVKISEEEQPEKNGPVL